MKGSFSKLLIIFGVFTIFAKLAFAMEDETAALQNTYAKNLFFDQEKVEFRLERNLPTIIFAAYFIDGTSLERQLTTSFKNAASIPKDTVDKIAKQIIKANIFQAFEIC